jgi:hypothetical protein
MSDAWPFKFKTPTNQGVYGLDGQGYNRPRILARNTANHCILPWCNSCTLMTADRFVPLGQLEYNCRGWHTLHSIATRSQVGCSVQLGLIGPGACNDCGVAAGIPRGLVSSDNHSLVCCELGAGADSLQQSLSPAFILFDAEWRMSREQAPVDTAVQQL